MKIQRSDDGEAPVEVMGPAIYPTAETHVFSLVGALFPLLAAHNTSHLILAGEVAQLRIWHV